MERKITINQETRRVIEPISGGKVFRSQTSVGIHVLDTADLVKAVIDTVKIPLIKEKRENNPIIRTLGKLKEVIRKKVSRCVTGEPHTRDTCPTGQPWRCRSKRNYQIMQTQENQSGLVNAAEKFKRRSNFSRPSRPPQKIA